MKLTDSNLHLETKKQVKLEKDQTYIVLKYLQEIDKRRSYADLSYSSLQAYAEIELDYSASEANNRISAMRLLKKSIITEYKLKDGSLSLTTAAEISRSLKHSPKTSKTAIDELILKVSPLSSRQAKDEIHNTLKPNIPREKKIILNERLLNLFEKYDCDKTEIQIIEELLLEKLKRTKIKNKTHSKPKNSRYIPRSVQSHIQKRSRMQCEYHGIKGRCNEKRFLEYDHIKAFSKGGTNDILNIQYLCRNHNQRKAAD